MTNTLTKDDALRYVVELLERTPVLSVSETEEILNRIRPALNSEDKSDAASEVAPIQFVNELGYDSEIACSMCWGYTEDIALLANNVFLVKLGDKYALIRGNGHKDDEYVIFNTTPRPDPLTPDIEEAYDNRDPDDSREEEFEAIYESAEIWREEALEATKGIALRKDMGNDPAYTEYLDTIHGFVESLVSAGYDRKADGFAELWIYNRAGVALQEWERRKVNS